MPGIRSRLQEIIGDKIFRHKVTFDDLVTFKGRITGHPDMHEVTTGASTVTHQLPSSVNFRGRLYGVVKMDSGAGEVKLQPAGADTINGYSNVYVGTQYQSVFMTGVVGGWEIVSGPIQPVAGEPSAGTPHPHAATAFNVLNAGSATTYTDINVGPSGLSLVLAGTKLIRCMAELSWRAINAAQAYGILSVRKKGSTEVDDATDQVGFLISPAVASVTYYPIGMIECELDTNCTFQYKIRLLNADSQAAYLTLRRYGL